MRSLKGMTFIEVLIAIVIAGIVISSMYTGLNFAYRVTRHNANKTMALNFAQGLMEEIKDKAYEDEYATEPNYHTGTYTNFLGPELNTEGDPEEDDDTNEDGSIDSSEFDDVDDYNGYEDTVSLYQRKGVEIEAIRKVEVTGIHLDQDTGAESDVDADGGDNVDVSEYGNITYKKITVTVSWDWRGKSYTETINTIVSKHS